MRFEGAHRLDIGSSYLMSEVQAAYLLAQLEAAEQIGRRRRTLWAGYAHALTPLTDSGLLQTQAEQPDGRHNAHMFYLKLRDPAARDAFISTLNDAGVTATFHYVPLHSSPAGRRFGVFHGQDRHTTDHSRRLVRLPLFYNMTDEQHTTVIDAVTRAVTGTR